jgi:hypothetical protein
MVRSCDVNALFHHSVSIDYSLLAFLGPHQFTCQLHCASQLPLPLLPLPLLMML